MAPHLSVAEQIDGRCILITGGLGFLGSVALEQLLRLTEVRHFFYELDRCCVCVREQGWAHCGSRFPVF